MKILYDYQVFSFQRVGGISRYFYELINSSQAFFSSHLAVKYHKNTYLNSNIESQLYPSWRGVKLGKHSFPGRGIFNRLQEKFLPIPNPDLLNQENVRSQLYQVKPDIFHPTYYDDYFLDDLQGTPFVLTIYDMIHELFPEHFINDKTSILKKKLFFLADQIIAISENTKKDIMDIYDAPGDKISVVHLANSLIKIDDNENIFRENIPKRYLLFVGLRGMYKNFQFFITAVSDLLKKESDLFLICTGLPFTKTEEDFFNFLGLSKKIFHYFVNDAELAHLYSNAVAFIFPSLYEGFGIPILEAFACDCPVLLSDSASLSEVGGEAAIYFNPKSAIEIRNAVNKVINDLDTRKTLIRNGKERLKHFSWETTVKKTTDVYKRCLSR